MIGLAVMAWLTVLICYGGNWVLGQCMIEASSRGRPRWRPSDGRRQDRCHHRCLSRGNLHGAVNIGGAISAEPVTATALAVAFTVGAGIDQGAAITLAVPVGVVTAFLSIFMNNVFLAFFAATFDKMAAEGNEKGPRASALRSLVR